VRTRAIFVSIATVGLMVGPAFAHGLLSSVAGARTECTITGTAANDNLNGTTKDDVICGKAGEDTINGEEGNDVIRGGQGDDGGGQPLCIDGGGGAPIVRGQLCDGDGPIVRAPIIFGLNGNDGSDIIKGQQDDDSIEGNGQNDKMYGGNGDDCLGADCTFSNDTNSEPGNDFLKTKDKVSGNDFANGGDNTDTCRIDAGDQAISCEL
jgi:Ca2+-binding RTX toxin-like protein